MHAEALSNNAADCSVGVPAEPREQLVEGHFPLCPVARAVVSCSECGDDHTDSQLRLKVVQPQQPTHEGYSI